MRARERARPPRRRHAPAVQNDAARTSYPTGYLPPLMLFEVPVADDAKLRLCDFASAGTVGNRYLTWFNVDNIAKTEFSQDNPLRIASP